jgi:hypothetical protein
MVIGRGDYWYVSGLISIVFTNADLSELSAVLTFNCGKFFRENQIYVIKGGLPTTFCF